jgi:hypothetical protein
VFKSRRRNPKNYDGTRVTSHKIGNFLPAVLKKIGKLQQDRPDLVIAAWPEMVGKSLAPMTEALSFNDGVLLVSVRNSTLYSLLCQNDKLVILRKLRKKFPRIEIRNIKLVLR